ncbi:uncharacterized protein LOC127731089 [Mytilus californianus]|uniref:uncharacterized protein LOC127731089 n=1 Tax=Mytilus californianus TaxID=6549 RepID=UPI00224680C1|nr:uncharacterized protein LOC127731089 [Mytilus californianus]
MIKKNVYYLLIWLLYIPTILCGLCTYYRRSSYTTSCFIIGRCTRYRRTSYPACCVGYSDITPDCVYSLCNGKPTARGGCTEVNPTDTIYYRNGGSRNQGGGTCISPDVCADCQDGFYINGALCTRLFVTETLNI